MKKEVVKITGGFLFLIGLIFFINSLSGITGYFIIEDIGEGTSSIFGLIFIIVGISLFIGGLENRVSKTKKELEQIFQDKKIKKNYYPLINYSKKLNYSIKEGKKHIKVYDKKGKFVTIIPRGSGGAKKGTYFGIIEALLEGVK